MRYILDDNGYIEAVSCTEISCSNKSCTEYTGTVPDGYDSLEDWAQNANIRAYKIVNKNLTLDSAKDAELTAIYEQEKKENQLVTYKDIKPTVYNVTGSAVTVATATNKTITSLTIPAGLYVMNAHVSFAANATGVRKIYISTTENSYANTRALADTRPASNHQATMSNMPTILAVEEETTYYLNVYQNSGSSLSCSGSLRALRVGDYVEYQAGL